MTAHNSKLARLSPDIFRCKYLKKTTKDRDWGPKGHQSKLAYGESNTHVTDDIFLIIPYWLHTGMPLPETTKLIGKIEKIYKNNRKTANNYSLIQKHTVNGLPALLHTSISAKSHKHYYKAARWLIYTMHNVRSSHFLIAVSRPTGIRCITVFWTNAGLFNMHYASCMPQQP